MMPSNDLPPCYPRGMVQYDDPLHAYLTDSIYPAVGVTPHSTAIAVYQLEGSHPVYLYRDQLSGVAVVGKYFGFGETRRLLWEYVQLQRVYARFPNARDTVPRPLGMAPDLNGLLVTAFTPGVSFSTMLKQCIQQQQEQQLFPYLTRLAQFLAALHRQDQSDIPIDVPHECCYLDKLIRTLYGQGVLHECQAQQLGELAVTWRDQSRIWSDCQVMLHGDATPPNFVFGADQQVVGIDFERMHRGDRGVDIGRICGELQHAFALMALNKYVAEPYIGHFLWHYAQSCDSDSAFFAQVCQRIPLYMAMTSLRIARNGWHSLGYRRQLVIEALLTLQHAPL